LHKVKWMSARRHASYGTDINFFSKLRLLKSTNISVGFNSIISVRGLSFIFLLIQLNLWRNIILCYFKAVIDRPIIYNNQLEVLKGLIENTIVSSSNISFLLV
jgi:hypothetical protein